MSSLPETALHQSIGIQHSARHALHLLKHLHRIGDALDLVLAELEDCQRYAEERFAALEE